MPHRTLADFLEELGRAGELAPVDAKVTPAWKSLKSPAALPARTALRSCFAASRDTICHC